MKKKTGILTLSSAQNYGAVLQVFSLMRFLQENYSETEVIDFTPDFICGRYKLIAVDNSSMFKRAVSIVKGLIKLPVPLMTRIRFILFRKKYLKWSHKRYIRKIDEDAYDQYIVGSDQVLNLSLTGNEKAFFLPFVGNSSKKATYAASLGLNDVTDEQMDTYHKGLKDFEYLSIREKNGVAILKKILPRKKIISNIDPVFLHDKLFWNKIACKKVYSEKYVLIYSLAHEAVAKSIEIAKLMFPQYKIYMITDSISKAALGVVNQRGVGPKQFLGLIRDAEFVITNSFHGCAFSIIYEKQFYVIPFRNTSSRMINLLQVLNLENRLVSSNQTLNNDEIDYDMVRGNIDSEVCKAREYFDKIYR